MPMTLEKLEYGIYRLHIFGSSMYDDVIQVSQSATKHKMDAGETHQVFIIDRDIDAEVDISFGEIRQLMSQQNIRTTHYLHIDTGTAIRVIVSGINRIMPLNIKFVPNMDVARIEARDILSRYTQPRPKRKKNQNKD